MSRSCRKDTLSSYPVSVEKKYRVETRNDSAVLQDFLLLDSPPFQMTAEQKRGAEFLTLHETINHDNDLP